MKGCIYLIRNLINGKGYVGQTVSALSHRFGLHKSRARTGHDSYLYQSMRKWGIYNFSVSKIVECDPLLLDDLEIHFIQFFGTFVSNGHGYNLTMGGNSQFKMSEETKVKMAAAKQGKKLGPHSVEHRAKIARAQIGNTNGKGRKGLAHSEQTKAKIAVSKRANSKRGTP